MRPAPFGLLLVLVMACAGPPAPSANPASPAARPAATPRPTALPAPLGLTVLHLSESPIPPTGPPSDGFAARRQALTPAATPDAAWKYVTVDFAVENRSDTPRLVGITGNDPSTTNLAGATLTAGDGKRYKPVLSYSSLGQRSASGLSLTSYPVLLRLPPGFRAVAESFGSQSIQPPLHNSLTFKLPATLTSYGSLTIPPLASLGPKTGEDDVSSRLRPLVGAFGALDLSSAQANESAAFPSDAAAATFQSIGATVSNADQVSVTVTSLEVSTPPDPQAASHGWKQLSVSTRYRNDDQQAHSATVSAWLFGRDGIVYTGDVPAIGDFGRALTAPQPSALSVWDGRSAGPDPLPPGQTQDGRRLVFMVPRELQSAVLVLGGDLEAAYDLSGIAVPPAP